MLMRSKDSCALTLQERVEADLLDCIQHGTYAPGEKIPSEHELAASFGVSRVTIRIALSRLVEKGYVVKRQGRGTFVRPTVHVESTLTSGSFTENCIKMGCTPSTRIICACENPADPAIAQMLGTNDSLLVEVRRLRLVDSVPCIVEFDYFPSAYRYLLTTPLEDRSLFSTIEEREKIGIAGFEDLFGIEAASEELAVLLGVEPETPLLKVTETVLDLSGNAIYVNLQFIATDRYTYAIGSRKQ